MRRRLNDWISSRPRSKRSSGWRQLLLRGTATPQQHRSRPPRVNPLWLSWPIKTPASPPVRKYLGLRPRQTSQFIITPRQILVRLLVFADSYNNSLGYQPRASAFLIELDPQDNARRK